MERKNGFEEINTFGEKRKKGKLGKQKKDKSGYCTGNWRMWKNMYYLIHFVRFTVSTPAFKLGGTNI